MAFKADFQLVARCTYNPATGTVKYESYLKYYSVQKKKTIN